MATRRQILAAALAAPALTVPAAAAVSLTCIPSADPSVWSKAMARYEALKAKDRQFHTEIYHPVMDPIHKLSPPYRFDHIARNGSVSSYCIDAPDLNKFDTDPGGLWFAVRDEIADAKAKYAAWRHALASVDANGLNDRSDALGSALYDVERELLSVPAPDLRALEWKVEVLKAESADSSIEPSDLEMILTDIRRLDGRGEP